MKQEVVRFGFSSTRGSHLKYEETQIHILCTWSNATIWIQLLGKCFSSGKLNKCEVIISYSNILFVLTFTQADIDVDVLINIPLWKVVDVNIG